MRDDIQTALSELEERQNAGQPVDDYLAAMFLPAVCFRDREVDRGLRIFEYAAKELREEAKGIRYFLHGGGSFRGTANGDRPAASARPRWSTDNLPVKSHPRPRLGGDDPVG